MPRARNIKPGFFKNADLAECSVWARLLFPGLWMLADKEGRLEDRPKQIKGELLPYDAQDVEPLLKELAARGFIVRYQNSEGRFIQISKFRKHQSPHYSEKPSVIKPPGFPENGGHIEMAHSGNSPPIMTPENGRSPLAPPPDSLIPDSLNPDSSSLVGSAPNGARHATDFSKTFIDLPTREGQDFAVKQALVAVLEPLYPAVDVPQTLREMKGWLIGNRDRLKTRKRMNGFITGWLQREQEKHGRQTS